VAEHFKIAIIGSGPGGLSAAARAAELKLPHILLEASAQISNTIFRYQKGKHVMAEPDALPLRSPLKFGAGTREAILESWQQDTSKLQINVRYGAEVSKIESTNLGGANPGFTITCSNKTQITADFCILGVGLQGNLRKMGVAGEEQTFVQYQLDDPDEFVGETIIVVGAGDAAIENAIALKEQNQVIIVNRKDEFARAKDGNLKAIMRAIDDGSIECYYNAAPELIEALPVGRKPGRMWLSTPKGRAQILCDRIIARLGADPPRKFVEACGVAFPSKDPSAVPAISGTYESNVKGLYIVGALGGYPLIKQAMNQGFEVIETILGRAIEPADQPLLAQKFSPLPGFRSVETSLRQVQANAPHLAAITPLQLREFMIDSGILAFAPGAVIFLKNDYTNSFFSIVGGNVEVLIDAETNKRIALGPGEFFGEMGLISGRRRSATVYSGPQGAVVIETPRRSMLRLIASVAAVKTFIDHIFIERALRSRFGEASNEQIREVAQSASVRKFIAGDVLFSEGDPGDCLHLVRSGSLTISRHLGGKDVVLAYVPAGQYVGEMALLGENKRTATARAAIATETIRVERAAFEKLLSRNLVLRGRIAEEHKAPAAM
jgi:CRP-like cAMP-binding protein/thioredoxin reductase